MKNRIQAIYLLILCFIVAVFSGESLAVSLESGFHQPPQIAKPLAWWDWINGSVTKEGIKADLEDMKRAGIGGVQLFDLELYMPEGPIRYGTDQWHEHVQFAIDTAESLGLEFHIMNCPGWSASGGPWITPEKSMKKVVWSEHEVSGPAVFKKKLDLPQLTGKSSDYNFYKDVAVFAVPSDNGDEYRLEDWETKIGFSRTSIKRPEKSLYEPDKRAIRREKVLNLSEYFTEDGILSCEIPEGSWVIIRFGYTTTGSTNHPAVHEGHGLEVDKFDKQAVEFQFNQALSRIIADAKPHLGKTFKGILFDSFEGGFQNWTEKFPTQFEQLNGYDLIPYLPVLTGRVIESQAVSESVLYDFRRTIDQLLAECYYAVMQRLAYQNKLMLYSESQGGPLNPFYCNEYVDVPMNEFWLRNYDKRIPLMKLSASSANVYGRQVVGAEAFTAIPDYAKWQNTPYSLKKAGDCAFTAGINRFIFHTYIHQPYSHLEPGFTMGRYGTHFGRLNSWWEFVPAWIDYLSRSQFLLQQGRTVTDFGFLFHDDILYQNPLSMTKTPEGFDYIICYPRNLGKMEYRDSQIMMPGGNAFKILVLPDYAFMTLDALKNVHRLVKSGAVVVGDPPAAPPGLKDLIGSRAEYEQLASELWKGLDKDGKMVKTFGKGRLFLRISLDHVISQLDLTPDIQFVSVEKEDALLYIHRKTDSEDVYFISNQTDDALSFETQFRITGKMPEFWDPASGKIWEAKFYNLDKVSTHVPLTLDPRGSVFVIFKKPLPKKWVTSFQPDTVIGFNDLLLADSSQQLIVNYSDKTAETIIVDKPSESFDIPGPWQVKFLDGRGAPPKIMLDSLISWTDHADTGVKYYSGIAEYTVRIDLPENFRKQDQVCMLDLGRVCDIAQISVNGNKPEILWKEPFRADVTKMLKAGENTITIKVANRWINRLVGDEQMPADCIYRENASKFTNNGILEFPHWLTDPQKAKARQRYTFSTWRHYSADSPLVESGLIGPVKLKFYKNIDIKHPDR
jgi:hypothetical protein